MVGSRDPADVAPVSTVAGHENDLPSGRSESAYGEMASYALCDEYQLNSGGERAGTHSADIVTRRRHRRQAERPDGVGWGGARATPRRRGGREPHAITCSYRKDG